MSKPRIYIAIVTFLPEVGGAERQAFAHARSLRERGYEATIMTLRHNRTWPQHDAMEGVPVMRVAGWVVGGRERFPSLLRKLAYLLGLLAMGWTLWWHRQRYDVLCVYQLTLLVVPAAVVCLLAGKHLVVNMRTGDAGGRDDEHDRDIGELDEHDRDIGELEALESLGVPVLRGTGYLLRRTHAVMVVLSSRMKQELACRKLQLPVTLCIPNGVDPARFVPVCTDAPTDERARTVVCVSRLNYQKGIDVLLHAWQLVHAQAPAARLIIVGIGPLQSQLERLAEALGIKSSVEFAGFQSDVPAQLQRGGLAVLASRYEGMPNAVLEAMACGLPCVATRVSGSEDLIQHSVNGLLVEPEDHRGLARALLTLLQDPALAQHYGRAARATIEQHYALDRITDRYVVLYETVARGGPLDRLIDHGIGAAGRR